MVQGVEHLGSELQVVALGDLDSLGQREIDVPEARTAQGTLADIAGPDQADEFGLHSRRHMACFGSLLWLAEEGYLRYVDTIRQEALDQAVLSHRAFTRLSAQASAELIDRFAPQQVADESIPPSVREDFSTHVHIIRETIRGGNSAQLSQVMQAIFFQDSH